MINGKQTYPTSYVTNMGLEGYVAHKVLGLIDGWIPDVLEKNPNIIEAIDLANHGRGPIDSPYTGALLEQNEFFGKHLTGLAYCYAMTNDPMILEAGDTLIRAMEQARGDDGYMGVHEKGNRFGGPAVGEKRLDAWGNIVAGGENENNWDIWGHYHAIYGLIQWYKVTGNQKAFDMARDGMDCCLAYFEENTYTVGFVSVNYAITHAYAVMYQETGDEKYLREAKRILAEDWPQYGNWMNDALAGKAFYESDLPRWEVLHSIMALGTLYETTGEKAYGDALEHIWWSIVTTDRHNTGGFTSGEKAIGNPYGHGAIETCSCVAWTGLGVQYLRLSRDAYVADELELSYYNTILGAITAQLREVTYDTPMEGVIIKCQTALPTIYNSGTPDFNCCQGNACRGIGEVSQWAALTDENALYLNYYGPGALHTKTPGGQAIVLKTEGSYPLSGAVRITVEGLERDEAFTLMLRIPSWSENTRLSLNGAEQSGMVPRRYYSLHRTWKIEDTIQLDLDMTLHCWVGEERFSGRTSLYYGPILMAQDEHYTGKSPEQISLDMEDVKSIKVREGDGKNTWMLFETKDTKGNPVVLIDFASAGKTGSRYTTWLRVNHSLSPIVSRREGTPIWQNGLTRLQNAGK